MNTQLTITKASEYNLCNIIAAMIKDMNHGTNCPERGMFGVNPFREADDLPLCSCDLELIPVYGRLSGSIYSCIDSKYRRFITVN